MHDDLSAKDILCVLFVLLTKRECHDLFVCLLRQQRATNDANML